MLMLPPLPRLMLCVAIGALVYLFVLVLLWRLAGRPNGIEETLFTAIARRRNARRD
jgi:hypothetical protein